MERIIELAQENLKNEVTTYTGRTAKLKKFNSFFDCTIEFGDGVVLEHVNYGCYWFGNVKHPDDIHRMPMEIGEVTEVRGRKVSVVDLKSKSDVAFMFEDGRVVTGRAYCDMNRGYFGDIHLTKRTACQVGDEIVNKKGEVATIEKVYEKPRRNKGAQYVDIAFFRDGEKILVEHKNYRTVRNGNVLCPSKKEQEKAMKKAIEVIGMPHFLEGNDGRLYHLESVYGSRLEVIVDGVLVSRVPADDYLNGDVNYSRLKSRASKETAETRF